MLTRVELEQLSSYHNPDYPVISFYLNIDKGRPDEAKVEIRLKNVLTEIEEQREQWTKAQMESVERDLERIRAFVRDQRVQGGQGVVAFACSADDFWTTYTFPRRVGNHVHLDHRPYVKPLFRILAHYEPICTVLIGKGKGRIFITQGDQIEERSDVFTAVPKRHDQGGWAQARLQRQHDEAVTHHLKTTAEQVFGLYQEMKFDKLLVAGTEELVSQFQEHLHPYLKERLVATFPLSLVASTKTIHERTRQIVDALAQQEALELVERLESESSAQNLGVVDLPGTLRAVQQGQVLTLLVTEGFAEDGKRCRGCGHLTVYAEEECPYCGGSLAPVADIVQAIADLAFDQGCAVKFLEGEAGRRLAKLGSIGALLRYRPRP